jgi:hypothetical protein
MRVWIRGLFVLLVAVLAALPAAAQIHEEDGEPIVYTLAMNDYNFVVEGQEAGEGLTLEAGQLYRLVFRNDGLVLHEVLIGRDPSQEGEFTGDYAEHLLAEVLVDVYGVGEAFTFEVVSPGFLEMELAHGQALAIQFTLTEDHIGAWEIGCFSPLDPDAPADAHGPTHYDVGMVIPLEVVAAS